MGLKVSAVGNWAWHWGASVRHAITRPIWPSRKNIRAPSGPLPWGEEVFSLYTQVNGLTQRVNDEDVFLKVFCRIPSSRWRTSPGSDADRSPASAWRGA